MVAFFRKDGRRRFEHEDEPLVVLGLRFSRHNQDGSANRFERTFDVIRPNGGASSGTGGGLMGIAPENRRGGGRDQPSSSATVKLSPATVGETSVLPRFSR